MKSDLFQSCGHCWVFQICWHIECSIFTASSFRIWNSSTGIPSPPLALFVVMFFKAHLTSHFRMSGSRGVITPSWLSETWRSFLHSSSVYSCPFLISSASDRFNFFQPHELQHVRLHRPSPSPGACSNLCPSSWWCHPATSSSVIPFSSCLQSFPASEFFPMSQFFTLGGQSIGVSPSVLPMTIQDWFPLGLTGWISLQFKGLLKSLLQHHSSKASIFWRSTFFMVQISHPYMTTGKTIALTRRTFVGKTMSLLFTLDLSQKAEKQCLCFLICCLGWS